MSKIDCDIYAQTVVSRCGHFVAVVTEARQTEDADSATLIYAYVDALYARTQTVELHVGIFAEPVFSSDGTRLFVMYTKGRKVIVETYATGPQLVERREPDLQH